MQITVLLKSQMSGAVKNYTVGLGEWEEICSGPLHILLNGGNANINPGFFHLGNLSIIDK